MSSVDREIDVVIDLMHSETNPGERKRTSGERSLNAREDKTTPAGLGVISAEKSTTKLKRRPGLCRACLNGVF